LDQSIVPAQTNATEFNKFFLSGATGFLGVFILRDLLRVSGTTVYVLVRATSKIDGRQRIKHAMKLHRLWDDSYEPRIVPVPGDLSKPLLGLTQGDFDEISREVDVVIHCAAFVHWLLPYKQMKDANVLGTQEVIRMAATAKNKPLHHVSTTAVFESDFFLENREEVSENVDLRPHYNGLRGGYAQSKWAAELLVSQARDRGIQSNIYRPAYISGDRENGVWTTDDFLCRVIRGCLQMGSYPKLDSINLDISPVDFVSGAIVKLSTVPAKGKTYHLTNATPTHFSDFFSVAASFGYDVKELPYAQWRSKLIELPEEDDNALHAVSSIFTDGYEDQLQNPPLQRANTESDLQASGTQNEAILRHLPLYFSYLVRSKFLPPPANFTPVYNEWIDKRENVDLVTRSNRSKNVNSVSS